MSIYRALDFKVKNIGIYHKIIRKETINSQDHLAINSNLEETFEKCVLK